MPFREGSKKEGCKAVYEVGRGSSREHRKVLGCGSADKVKLPLFVVYKAKNLWANVEQRRSCRSYSTYSVSDSGWMEKARPTSVTGSNIHSYHPYILSTCNQSCCPLPRWTWLLISISKHQVILMFGCTCSSAVGCYLLWASEAGMEAV